MCKLYLQPVEVNQGPGGHPFSFSWKGNWYLVTRCFIHENSPNEWPLYRGMGLDSYKPRYRCKTDTGMDCDLVLEKGNWLLERVWD